MKSNSKPAGKGKRIFQLSAGLTILLLPVLIVWSAMYNLQNQVRAEKVNATRAKLQKLLDSSEPIINPFTDIFHDFNSRTNDLHTNFVKLHDLLSKSHLQRELRTLVQDLSQRFGYPVEVSTCLKKLPDDYEQFSYKNDFPVEKNRLTELSRLMYLIDRDNQSKKNEEELILELGREARRQGIIFLDRHFLIGGEDKLTKTFIRTGNRLDLLLSAKFKGIFATNILIDLSRLDEKSRILQKVENFKDKEAGLVFFMPGNAEYFASKLLRRNPGMVIRALDKISLLPEKAISFQIDNHLFVTSAANSQLNFRAMACAEIPPPEREEELQLLLALVVIFSLFLSKTVLEAAIFSRWPQVSIKIFILSLFMIICLLPLVGAVYLASEHVVTMFKLGINQTSAEMSRSNTSLDLQTLDNFRRTLHLLKSLDSVEKLRQFAGASENAEIDEVVIKTLNKILRTKEKKSGGYSIGETWVFDSSENLACYEFNSGKNHYETTDVIDPFLGDLFKQKFKEFMQSQKLLTQKKKEDSVIEVDELKIEMLNEAFLNIFGPKAYFDQKKDIGHLLELKTHYDRNFFYSMPVSENGKVKYILSHVFDSHSLRNHFPFEKLTSDKDSSSFVIYGWEEFLSAKPRSLKFYNQNFPEALDLAKKSHLNKFKLEQQIVDKTKNHINMAQPAKFSDFIITATRKTPNLLELKTGLVKDVARLTAGLVAFMTLLAMIVAQFFQAPINELTRATNEIIKENFQVRINSLHPDEFSEISNTFNHMARQLEEGKLLSTFVAESLTSELDSAPAAAQRKKVSVLFSGITNFKNHPDQKNPEKLFQLLQVHLEQAAAVAAEFAGEIDKMIEDKVMIVFEDKAETESSNQRAVLAACKLGKNFSEKIGQTLAIGINSGEVVSGIMGSEKVRLAKTVVGDPVNLAARLAAIAENTGGGLIVSAQSLANLKHALPVRKLEITSVKGKTQSVEIFSVILNI